jgi:hypothetical protein
MYNMCIFLSYFCIYWKRNPFNMYKSDKIDYEIISLLLEYGRMPVLDIVRRINDLRKTTTSIVPTA